MELIWTLFGTLVAPIPIFPEEEISSTGSVNLVPRGGGFVEVIPSVLETPNKVLLSLRMVTNYPPSFEVNVSIAPSNNTEPLVGEFGIDVGFVCLI